MNNTCVQQCTCLKPKQQFHNFDEKYHSDIFYCMLYIFTLPKCEDVNTYLMNETKSAERTYSHKNSQCNIY